jgi:hypothetical protein
MKRFSVAVAFAMSLAPVAARAYHAKTHAGITERAVLASSLHKKLTAQFGRALGLYEPLTLDGDPLHDGERRELDRRLRQLDPEGGYVPDHGKQAAIDWLVAGAAFEGVPGERLRNHFYDPATERGLDDRDGSALRTRVASAAWSVGSVRGIFTGSSFDGSGMAAPDWIVSRDNDWGLTRFGDELEHSVSAATASARDAALARALLAAGAIVDVVEDAGDPTFVRNDYRVALEAQDGPFERYTLNRYGRLGLPDVKDAPITRARLREFFHDADGNGLADRTQARFFSPGTLPDSARFSFPHASPPREDDDDDGYVEGAVPHLLRYHRAATGTVWLLDARCFADYAAALVPETTRYAAGVIELLFRGRLGLAIDHGGATVTAHDVPLGAGVVTLYADVGAARVKVATRNVSGAADGVAILDAALPGGTTRVAAVFRGVDGNGEPLVVVQEQPVK